MVTLRRTCTPSSVVVDGNSTLSPVRSNLKLSSSSSSSSLVMEMAIAAAVMTARAKATIGTPRIC